MTESPSEAPARPTPDEVAARFADVAGAITFNAEHATPKIHVSADDWVEAHRALKEHLPFFSYLAAVDWSADVAVGEPPEGDEVEERYEVVTRLSDVEEGIGLIVSTAVPRERPVLPTLTGVFAGADWHEREAAEMFGIDFDGHPNLVKLYLPDGFEGHPLRKSFPLLSRQVKPWPGSVDVEDMPSVENPEAPSAEGSEEEGEPE